MSASAVPSRLAGVVQAPEVVEVRVVRDRVDGVDDPIGFRIENVRTASVLVDGLRDIRSRSQADELEVVDRVVGLDDRRADIGVDDRARRRPDGSPKPDKKSVRNVLGTREHLRRN